VSDRTKPQRPVGIDRGLTAYGDLGFSKYLRRAFLASAGFDRADLDRPVVGIADTSSEYTTCHRHMPEIVQAVKRGVLEAGGLPLVFPTTSLGEILLSPTSMPYRNLLAMETEEMIRAQPMDAVVLLGGCDKTVPAQLMAAASANVPAIAVVTGPMLTGSWRGERLGACTDCRRYWALYRAGELDDAAISEIEESLCPTGGTCMVMGTASTMACIAEALGLMLPGGATAPSGSGDRLRHAVAAGRRAMELVARPIRPLDILTRAAFNNALSVLAAVGGSTNAIIHLTAIARRAGVLLTLDDVHDAAQRVPLLVDCKPAGAGYLEDMHRAGGVPTLLKTLAPLLDLSAIGVSGRGVGVLVELV
jgi:dihydroxy-acid dehydratase